MIEASFNLLLQTASQNNILTLTTACSTACVFCSHNQNPPGIEVFCVHELPFEKISTLIEYLDPDRKIVIGESATRICEGEPFLHPDILHILAHIREKYPHTVIQITTSAVPLNKEMIGALQQIGDIELNVSLNSASEAGRKKLYRGKPHMNAVQAVQSIAECSIRYSGSIVAMPHIVGIEDISETVSYLSKNGAETIRIFVPGYTRYTKLQIPDDSDIQALQDMVKELREKIETPILLEPIPVKNLSAVVEGVIESSPAKESGIRTGDIILKINGENVYSRVDTYYKLFAAADPALELVREEQLLSLSIQKKENESSGAVFSYDMSPQTVAEIQKAIRRNRNKHILILTSELAYEVLVLCVRESENVQIEKAKNLFFGGNIRCAGLLTVHDIIMHLAAKSSSPEVLLLPGIMFDRLGRDLTGTHFMKITEELGIKLEII